MAEFSETSLNTLPEELLIEILLHVQDVTRVLNIKSIGRCRCVSKTWRSLLSIPQFAESRLDHGPEKVMFITEEDLPYVATLSDHDHVVATKAELPFLKGKTFRAQYPMQGSCHGLVLLFFRQGLLLVNPATLQGVEIPFEGSGGYDYGYGLGYDSCTDDYKVISVQEDDVDVYSVRARTWRTIPNVQTKPGENSLYFSNYYFSIRPFVNGRINFVSPAGADEAGTRTFVLAAFNVATEELESLPYPKGVDFSRIYYEIFTVLGGCLVMVLDEGSSYDVWLMKEYGVQDSWTKFTIKTPYGLHPRGLCFLDANEYISFEYRKFVAHNWRNMDVRELVVNGVPDDDGLWRGISFRESLIFPIYN